MCIKKRKKTTEKSNICDLKLGEKGIIAGIALSGDLKTRLIELGFSEGEEVECVLLSPLGDPIAFRVCDLVMALRQDDAKNILLKKNFADKDEADGSEKAESKNETPTANETTNTENRTGIKL